MFIVFAFFSDFFCKISTHCAGSESPSDSLASSEEKSFPTPDLLDLSLEELGSERSSVAFSTWGSGSFLAQALSGRKEKYKNDWSKSFWERIQQNDKV